MDTPVDTERTLRLGYAELEAAVGVDAAPALWEKLQESSVDPFDTRRMVMWFGGICALLSSTIFVGTVGFAFGRGVFSVVLAAVMAGVMALGWQLKQRGHTLAGGLLATLFCGLTPLLVFTTLTAVGIEGEFGDYRSFYNFIGSQWIWMEFVTIAVGLVVVWKFDFGFATLPPTVAGYFLVMDAGRGLLDADLEAMAFVVGFGLGAIMLGLGIWFQFAGKDSHATWLLIYGILSFYFGASQLANGSALALLYLILGLSFVILGKALRRGVPVTLGGIAAACSLSYFTYDLFDGSIIFSFVMFCAGIGVVVAAALHGQRSGAKPVVATPPPPSPELVKADPQV